MAFLFALAGTAYAIAFICLRRRAFKTCSLSLEQVEELIRARLRIAKPIVEHQRNPP